MKPETENTWVDAVIGQINPVSDAELEDWDLDSGYQDLLQQVVATEATPKLVPLRRRRLSPKATGLALAAVVVIGTGAAAAVGGGALTGVFGQPGSTENDTSEFANPISPKYPALERQLFQELLSEGLRFPPNVNTHQVIDNTVSEAIVQAKQFAEGKSALDKSVRRHGIRVQVTGIKGSFAGQAQCAWEYYWIDAYKSDSGAHVRTAIRGMSALNDVITTTPTKDGTRTGSITAETNRKKTLVQDVRLMKRGDISFFERDTSVNCANSAK
jgi:hypothetical protein